MIQSSGVWKEGNLIEKMFPSGCLWGIFLIDNGEGGFISLWAVPSLSTGGPSAIENRPSK